MNLSLSMKSHSFLAGILSLNLHYRHLSMNECERMLILNTENEDLHAISKAIDYFASTVSRELKRKYAQQWADLKVCPLLCIY